MRGLIDIVKRDEIDPGHRGQAPAGPFQGSTLSKSRMLTVDDGARASSQEPACPVVHREHDKRTKLVSEAIGAILGSFAGRLPGRIKRDKGVWWMPWRQEAMKDVALCDKSRGGESTL